MDTLALIVGSCSNSLIFYRYPGNEDRPGNFRENLWEYFSLGVGRLFNQTQWIAVKKNVSSYVLYVCPYYKKTFQQMQDWILAMMENEHVKVEQRRRMLDALPSTSGIEKETFFRIMALI